MILDDPEHAKNGRHELAFRGLGSQVGCKQSILQYQVKIECQFFYFAFVEVLLVTHFCSSISFSSNLFTLLGENPVSAQQPKGSMISHSYLSLYMLPTSDFHL